MEELLDIYQSLTYCVTSFVIQILDCVGARGKLGAAQETERGRSNSV